MRWIEIPFVCLLLTTATARAEEADVERVSVRKTAPAVYDFDVTVRHADEGWEHYADRWDVVGPDGTVYGTRTLLHPHVNEQPFTRSLADVKIPESIREITVRAHDSVHGYRGKTLTVELPRTLGDTAAFEAEARVDRNVVYGMYSGTALLMDVHYPKESNGYGVLFIWGSGWHAPLSLSSPQLKDRGSFPPLTEAGYTVFVINHRAAPRFRYPSAVEDAQRAVRFIRHMADHYGVDDERLGGVGGSSGAHLVSMLGTLEGSGNSEDPDPVNRQSAKLQCVVTFAAPTNLAVLSSESGTPAVTSFVGMRPLSRGMSKENRTYSEASPTSHVSANDSPFLLIHGDADSTVPFEQAELLERALQETGLEVRLVRVPKGPHGILPQLLREGWLPTLEGRFEVAEVVGWFDRHLRRR
jgi:acetyl esterase/lipase